MLSDKELVRLSKFISLVLRHQPEAIDLSLDENGWASVDDMLTKMQNKGFAVDHNILQQVVATNNKQRFAFNGDGTRIRANQGHSINVDVQLQEAIPPRILYHGTAEKNIPAIQQHGLLKQSRQHVHLSADKETAIKVGQRHGKPVIFHVLTKEMREDGFHFYLSANGVWLTDHVPPNYLVLVT